MVPQTRWGSPLHKEVRASRTLSKVLGEVTHQRSEGVDHPPSPAVSNNSVGSGGPRGSRDHSCSCAQSIASFRSWRSGSAHSQVTDSGKESSSNSELSHEEEDDPHEDENAKACKGKVEVLRDGQAASDGEEGQGHTRTLTQSLTPGRRSSPASRSSANPAPRRACLPRTQVNHLSRKSS